MTIRSEADQSRPTPPFVSIRARFVPSKGVFVPCEETDSRGKLLLTIDANGRTVTSILGNGFKAGRVVGYRFPPYESDMWDPENGKAWLAAHPVRRVPPLDV